MARARFSIGIDLGTTNSALAFAPLVGDAKVEVLAIPQWETVGRLVEPATLPSFLYLPEEAVAAQLRGRSVETGEWIVGRLARRKAGETPGRVIHSAKSWLSHHTADRSAPFLPWGSDELTREQKVSPVRASALILSYLRHAWNDRFAGSGFPFEDQEITVTVPASFDAAAQQLTLAAAAQAGFPDRVRLLEEPQAAFHWWLAQHDPAELWRLLAGDGTRPRRVLVVDIGGGTSDFSLFELHGDDTRAKPAISRVAVSEHILLGGDNIDLAIAHLAERRLAQIGRQLSGAQWSHLVSDCRDLKERVLSGAGPPKETFAIAIAGTGSSLIAGSQAIALARAEIESLLLDGFFPECNAQARPHRTQAALREWGLPYASDSAITRHLADFLRDRPRADAVLFNGGTLEPPLLRQRLRDQIGRWQDGSIPIVLEQAEPALAVARGAAEAGVSQSQSGRISAGAPRAVFLEVQGAPTADGLTGQISIVCVLPRGAPPEQLFEIRNVGLELRTDQLVQFQAYSSTRHGASKAGDILPWREGELHRLPPLQTVVRTEDASRVGEGRTVPVRLAAKMNALGLLQVSCVSEDPAIPQSWPLEFNLRPQEGTGAATSDPAAAAEPAGPTEPNVTAEVLQAARKHIGAVFARPPGKAGKLTGGAILKSLESILGLPRSEWNAALLRALWPALEERTGARTLSVEHEEAWLYVAGYLLRPGFGVAGDALRMDSLWQLRRIGPGFPGKRIKTQEYILWRRLAGGLTRERQEKLLLGEIDTIRSGKAPAEFVRLAGSLELIPHELKAELINRFIETAVALAGARQDCAPYLAALGLLLNRAPLYAGPETVVSPDFVEHTYAAFRRFDWAAPGLLELQTLFLRATRVVGDRGLDVPKRLRDLIADKLESSGVTGLRTARIRGFVPIERSDRASLYGEPLPPGLVLGTAPGKVPS